MVLQRVDKLYMSSLTTRRMAWTYPGWSYLAATIPPSCLNNDINVNISLDLWMLTSTPIHCRSEFLFRQRRSISLQGCSEWRHRHTDPTRERLLKTLYNCFEEESHNSHKCERTQHERSPSWSKRNGRRHPRGRLLPPRTDRIVNITTEHLIVAWTFKIDRCRLRIWEMIWSPYSQIHQQGWRCQGVWTFPPACKLPPSENETQ